MSRAYIPSWSNHATHLVEITVDALVHPMACTPTIHIVTLVPATHNRRPIISNTSPPNARLPRHEHYVHGGSPGASQPPTHACRRKQLDSLGWIYGRERLTCRRRGWSTPPDRWARCSPSAPRASRRWLASAGRALHHAAPVSAARQPHRTEPARSWWRSPPSLNTTLHVLPPPTAFNPSPDDASSSASASRTHDYDAVVGTGFFHRSAHPTQPLS